MTQDKALLIRDGRKNGQDLIFAININPCEYGNYYVSVTNIHTYTGYLYPDNTIRTSPSFRNGMHGYYLTQCEAAAAIDDFLGKPKRVAPMSDNSTLKSLIDQVLGDFVAKKKMFTAYDVTVAIRHANPGVQVFHSVVKTYVHSLFDERHAVFNQYDRALIDIGTPSPWCYYIPGVHDHNTYLSSIGVGPQVQPNIPNPLPTKSPVIATFGGISGG